MAWESGGVVQVTIEDSSYQSKLEMTVARIYVDWAYGMEAGSGSIGR